MSNDTILEFRNIDKSFPGVQALDQVSFGINKGEVHALVGENGAGKSTLMKITAGLYQPDSGEVVLNGEAVQIKNAQQALQLGVAMVPQELNLVPETMIAENIFLGIEPRNKLGVVNRRALHHQAREVLASLGLEMDTRQKVKDLAVAEQQMIQIARALAFNCNILIMDEPTAPLSEREKNVLFEQIRALQTRGTTIIYISHRMEEIFEISDRITVLRDGKLMRTLDRSEATQDEIVSLMIGRPLQEFLHTREQRQHGGETILEVRGFAREGLFEDISFSLHRGEILGFAGLVGAGRTETLSSLFGSPPPDRGDVLLKGKTVTIRTPTDAIGLGIGYVPEERKRQGLFPIMSVLQNISIPFLNRLQRLTVIKRKDERLEGEQLSQQLRIQTPSMSQQVGYLSGGNQQKVILARWLGSGSGILILDEPTRGIDVNAKAEIHALITSMVNEGKSIILISSELQELLALADRIIVMREGHMVGEVYPEDVTEEEILRMAMWGVNSNGTTSGISADVDETEKGGNSD